MLALMTLDKKLIKKKILHSVMTVAWKLIPFISALSQLGLNAIKLARRLSRLDGRIS